jgi:hypothetical protein
MELLAVLLLCWVASVIGLGVVNFLDDAFNEWPSKILAYISVGVIFVVVICFGALVGSLLALTFGLLLHV